MVATETLQETDPKIRRLTTPVIVCLAGLALTVIGAFLPLWQLNNSFDHRFPELVTTWWKVSDLDPRQGASSFSFVSAVPLVLTLAVTAFTLSGDSVRRWFAPMVGVAIAMWLSMFVAWYVVYEDHAASVDVHAGALLMGFGLAVSLAAVMYDAASDDWGL